MQRQASVVSASSADSYMCHVRDEPLTAATCTAGDPSGVADSAVVSGFGGPRGVGSAGSVGANLSPRSLLAVPTASSTGAPLESSGPLPAWLQSFEDVVSPTPNFTITVACAPLRDFMSTRSPLPSPRPYQQQPVSPSSSPLPTVGGRTADETLAVGRIARTTRSPPWNSKIQDVACSPKEELPRIDTHRKSRYDYLSEGMSLAEAEKMRAAATSSSRRSSPQRQTMSGPGGRPGMTVTAARSASAVESSMGGGNQSAGTLSMQRQSDTASATGAAPLTGVSGHEIVSENRGSRTGITSYGGHDVSTVEARRLQSATDHIRWAAEYKEQLLNLLHSIDFPAAGLAIEVAGSAEGNAECKIVTSTSTAVADEALDKCRRFLRACARDGTQLSCEDLHSLLLLFTPPGVALQEAVDFLWTECDHRTSLGLADLTRVGARLRERLDDYDKFVLLADAAKLAATYTRVFPNDPLPDTADASAVARRRLVAAAVAAGNGTELEGARSLRVYETIFLADYCVCLHRRGTGGVDSAELAEAAAAANRAVGGDLCGDLQRHRRELRGNSASPHEAVAQTHRGGSESAVHEVDCDAGAEDGPGAAGHVMTEDVREDADTAAGWSSTDGETSRKRDSVASTMPVSTGRGTTRPRRAAAPVHKAETTPASWKNTTITSVGWESLEQRSVSHQPSRSPPRRRPSFNFMRQAKGSTQKYLGRSIEADYIHRVQQDTRLIYLLQAYVQAMSVGNDKAGASGEVLFNTDIDMDAELQDIERQVDSLQEELKLKQLQDTAAKEEGIRKTAVVAAAAAAASTPTKGNTSVFINGLDPRTTDADLRVFFAACGTVVRLTILQDRATGRPKGSAYVEFEREEQAQSAILKDGQSLHGRPLKIAVKRDNVPAFQRGGAGVRGGGGFFPSGGRGGRGGMTMNPQIAAMATMMATMMAGSGAGFSPYGAGPAGAPGGPAGGGGRGGGRGRGRGRGRDLH